jgi:hypothetical protein
MTTGQYLTVVLLGVSPTPFGAALGIVGNKADPSPDDWRNAVEQVSDSRDLNDALLTILGSPQYQPIIKALRTPRPLKNTDGSLVNYNDGTPVMIDYASKLRDMVWNNGPWSGGPPHPAGANLLNLIDLLQPYNEAAGTPGTTSQP